MKLVIFGSDHFQRNFHNSEENVIGVMVSCRFQETLKTYKKVLSWALHAHDNVYELFSLFTDIKIVIRFNNITF